MTKKIAREQLLLRVAAATVLGASAAHAGRASLAVHVHGLNKNRAVNKALSAELPGVEVTVYGRYRDFSNALKSASAVLTLRPVLAHEGLAVALSGQRGGRVDEAYSLVSIGAPPSTNQLKTIGAVDFLGRAATGAFVNQLVGAKGARVRRVTKIGDLLPLLQFRSAEAVVVPDRFLSEITGKTQLGLKSRSLKQRVGLPAVAIRQAEGERVAKAIRAFTPSVNRLLGVDKWQ